MERLCACAFWVVNVQVEAVTADNLVLKESTQWTNSPGALKPQFMALVPGGYLATIDTTNDFIAKIFLSNVPQWVEYAGVTRNYFLRLQCLILTPATKLRILPVRINSY